MIPLDVYASHSYEAGVQGDAIPDNTHIDLSQLTLRSGGVFPLYDASPNFVSGHFLLRSVCAVLDESEPPKPLVTVIAGHIDELENLTHVDKVPLFYVGQASTDGSLCISCTLTRSSRRWLTKNYRCRFGKLFTSIYYI